MLITPQEAIDIVLRRVRPNGTEFRPLREALGHYLAEDVRADRDMPPADRAAMDGYAVRAEDLAEFPCSLRLVGEVAAGSPAHPEVKPGTCVRILTGGNVPPGADTVVMVEMTEEKDDVVTFRAGARRGANIFRRGENTGKDALLLRKGTPLTPVHIGLCATVGKAEIEVFRRPRVGLLCTGLELRGADDEVEAHELRDYNGPALMASLSLWGYPDVARRNAPDEMELLASELGRMLAERDVVLLTGGVSVGKYDLVPEAVQRMGSSVRFHGVRMKPGKPILYAATAEGKHVFGLPGNPLSALTGFHEFALPALRLLSGCDPDRCRPALHVRLGSKLTSKGERTRYALARFLWHEDGPRVEPVDSRSSADVVAAGAADGAVVIPPDVRVLEPGSMIEFRAWRPLP